MALLPKRPVRRRPDGRFDLNLDADERSVLANYLGQLRELLMTRNELLDRLYPTAYPDDPLQEQEYQELMHGDLIESRFAALDTIEQTLNDRVVDEAELTRWLQAINALRLVLGTRLGVTQDDESGITIDEDDPAAALAHFYEYLGWLLSWVVEALTDALPESSE